MTDHDPFDLRIGDALRAYAAEAPVQVDAAAFARAVVGERSRRSRWSGLRVPSGRRSALVWVVVGALAVVGSILALAAVGALRSSRVELSVDPSFPIPAELYGEWQAEVSANGPRVPAGQYTLDLNARDVIRGPAAASLDWAGRAVAFIPNGPDAYDVVIASAGGCGTGRYSLRATEPVTTPGEPSASPHAGGVSPTLDQSETVRLTPVQDECADRLAILGAASWTRARAIETLRLGPFAPGETYGSGSFTEPFTFVMPRVDDHGENAGLPDQFRYASRYVADGGLRFGGPWWSMRFIDDLPVHADLCDVTSAVTPDVPQTPPEIEAWLRSSRGLTVSEPVAVPVDGRTALRVDLDAESCRSTRLPLGGYYSYLMRAYAIPTGDDAILLIGGSDAVNVEAVKAAMDAFVRSMHFR
jgi:hypothetical protein